uniref:Glutamate-gated chloride channel n=1 Tax=Panagrellus redivivus TaxID=6233 RepID=A0A7E4VCX3_PANRE
MYHRCACGWLTQALALILIALITASAGVHHKKKRSNCKRTQFDRKTTNFQAWREQMTICDLLDNYDPAVRPPGRDPYKEKRGPVIVKTSLRIRSINAVKERNMEYVAQFRFQQEWFDERLRFTHLNEYRNFEFINVAKDQKLWIPDTFFQNERNGWYHMLDQENKFIKIRSDGKVFYNRRLTLILSCNMNLLKYPMDVQKCVIDFASYAYTANDIIYKWKEEGIKVLDTVNSALPNFVITKFSNETCDSVTNTGSYSCLRVELTLTRVFSFFLLQLYIPSAMLVAVSWVSYWIDWKSTAARVPLAIVTLLTMIVTHHSINSNLPPVSYTKAIDVWIGSCGIFIFASLIEYAVVNYMGIQEEHREMRKITNNQSRLTNVADNSMEHNSHKSSMFAQFFHWKRGDSQRKSRFLRRNRKLQMCLQYDGEEDIALQSVNVHQPEHVLRQNEEPGWTTVPEFDDLVYVGQRKRVELVRWCSLLSARGKAERIDIVSRMLFPIAFVLFNFAYWSIYLSDIIDTSISL